MKNPFYRYHLNPSYSAELYHGSSSETITGQIRMNLRDSGWFGNGFYLSSNKGYAQRWGQFIHRMRVFGNFAEIQVTGTYKKIDFLGDAAIADQEAGGIDGWFRDEAMWSETFTRALQRMGYDGVRVHFDEFKDVEVVVFDPSKNLVLVKS